MDNFIEWCIKKLVDSLEQSGKTDRAKLIAAYDRIGRIREVVNAAYDRLGEILKPQQPIG